MFWPKVTIALICLATAGCAGRPLLTSGLTNRPETSEQVLPYHRHFASSASRGSASAVSPLTLSKLLRSEGDLPPAVEPVTPDTIVLDENDRVARERKQEEDFRRWDSTASKAMGGICVGCGMRP